MIESQSNNVLSSNTQLIQTNWEYLCEISPTIHLFGMATNEKQIRFKLQSKPKPHVIQIYETKITSLEQAGMLSKYFDTPEQLLAYMKQLPHFEIDITKWTMSINERTKKDKLIQLAILQFCHINTIQKSICQQLVQTIKQGCSEHHTVNAQLIRNMFITLAQGIQVIFNSIQDNVQDSRKKMAEIGRKLWDQIKNIKQKQVLQQQKKKQKMVKIQQQYNQLQKNCIHDIQDSISVTYDLRLSNLERLLQEKDIQIEILTKNYVSKKELVQQIEKLRSGQKKSLREIVKNFTKDQKELNNIKFSSDMSQMLNRMQQKLYIFMAQTEQKFQKIREMIDTRPQFVQKICQPVNAAAWIDEQCAHYKNAIMSTNSIIARQYSVRLLGKVKKIQTKQIYFNATLTKMQTFAALGIANSQYNKKSNFSKTPQFIYLGSDGHCWDGEDLRQQKGVNFVNGETVTVVADFVTGTVEWRVKGVLRHKIYNSSIKDKEIKWVPYMFLNQPGDCISIVE